MNDAAAAATGTAVTNQTTPAPPFAPGTCASSGSIHVREASRRKRPATTRFATSQIRLTRNGGDDVFIASNVGIEPPYSVGSNDGLGPL